MLRTVEQYPLPSPLAAIDSIEGLAKQPYATLIVREVVDSPEWQALLAIGKSGSGEIHIKKIMPARGEAGREERLVIVANDNFQLDWLIQADRKLLHLVIASEGRGDFLWRSQCSVCLHWEEENAPTDLLWIVHWIDNKCMLARIRAGADDLARSRSMHR